MAVTDVDFSSLGFSKTADQLVGEFLISYFEASLSVAIHERAFFETNKLKTTKIDYLKLRRFVMTAIDNFQDVDNRFLSGTLLKLKNDVFSLFDYVQELGAKTKIIDMVFTNEFLKNIKEYGILEAKLEESLSRRSKFEGDCNALQEKIKQLESTGLRIPELKSEHKTLKLQLGDASHNFALAREENDACSKKMATFRMIIYPLFTFEFKKKRAQVVQELLLYANSKAYYLDKFLWVSAKKSPAVANFLKTANIDGNYDMKTFIKYYLKNINAEIATDTEWHQYLAKAMEMM